MKKIKKLLAMIMAMTMVLGMAMTVSAAPNDDWTISITGTGIEAGESTVNYGQIIAADPTSPIGWKFAENLTTEQVQAFVNAWNSASKPAGTLDEEGVLSALANETLKETPENKNAESGTITTSRELSAALAAVTGAATKTMDISHGADVEESGAGLYIVVAHHQGYSYLPMAAYMNSDGDPVAVVAKGSEDQLKKTVADDGTSVAPGDEVTYTIKQQYLYFAPNAENKNFTISDKITNGTIKMDSLSVGYANTADGDIEDTLEVGNDYSVSTTPDTGVDVTGFTLNFGEKLYNPDLAGKTLVITYTVVVGALSEETVTAVSNQASSSNGTGQIVETKPVSFTVTKVDKSNNEEKLGGAEFTIYKEVAEAIPEVTTTITYDDQEKNVIVVGTITTSSEGTDKGTATINNLDAQETYYVKETKAPTGYSLNDEVFLLEGATANTPSTSKVTIEKVKYDKTVYTFQNFQGITVDDTKLASLPSTGGIGTTIFTIGGCAIMIAAAALYFVNRRKSEEN